MKTQTTLLAALAAMTLAAPAFAQAAPDPIRTDSLTEIARKFGDSFGHITTTDAAGGTLILAYGVSSYVVYTAGDGISTVDDIAFCVEDAAGGLSSCVPPGSTDDSDCEKYCDASGCDGWCECDGLWACAKLAFSGKCTAPLDCADGVCACTNS